MRVGFDVSALEPPHSLGVRRVARSLLEELEARGRLEVVRLCPPAGRPLLSWRQLELPRRVVRDGLVGLHSFTSAVTLLEPGRRVQTVHELPWLHGESENAGPAHRVWARLGSRRADRVICPTHHVARDLGARLAPRVRVVPWGVGPEFSAAPRSTAEDAERLAALVPEFAERRPWILCPGAVRAKKRLDAVLAGVARLEQESSLRPRVLVTGGRTARVDQDLALARRLGIERRVTILGTVSEADLAALLRRATLVPVLSRSEGFGLTVLEALATGCRVLVPEHSAQAEVAGGVGHLLAHISPGSVAAALAVALGEPDTETGRRARISRAESFTWGRAAEAVESIWGELA